MNNELDKYLQGVAHELRGLEAEKREAELREMRGHLEAIVARLMEGGLSESEAIEATIAQFGAARRVGKELKRAKRPAEATWRILLAPLSALACQIVFHLVAVFWSLHWTINNGGFGSGRNMMEQPVVHVLFGVFSGIVGPFTAGLVAAKVAPERAGANIAALYSVLAVASWQLWPETQVHMFFLFYLLPTFLGASMRSNWGHKKIHLKRA